MTFFLEYSLALVLVMILIGFLLGIFLGYLFWGVYRGRARREQLEVDRIKANLKNQRASNRDLKAQLAGRS